MQTSYCTLVQCSMIPEPDLELLNSRRLRSPGDYTPMTSVYTAYTSEQRFSSFSLPEDAPATAILAHLIFWSFCDRN